MKALYAHPDWEGDINHNAIASFLRHNYIPAPHSIHKHVQKLQPGQILSVDRKLSKEPVIEYFWTLEEAIRKGHENPFKGSDAELIDTLGDLLSDSVKRQMIADVSLGAFLSGGIDSYYGGFTDARTI